MRVYRRTGSADLFGVICRACAVKRRPHPSRESSPLLRRETEARSRKLFHRRSRWAGAQRNHMGPARNQRSPTAADAGDAFTISLSADFNICFRAGCYGTVKLNVAVCDNAPLVPVITME